LVPKYRLNLDILFPLILGIYVNTGEQKCVVKYASDLWPFPLNAANKTEKKKNIKPEPKTHRKR